MMTVRLITLARKITIQLAIYLSLIFIILLVISVVLINRQMHSEISKKADFILRYNVEALSKPLWDLDDNQMHKIVDHISHEDFIVRVILKDEDSKVIDEAGDIDKSKQTDNAKFIDTEGLEFHQMDIFYRYKDFDKHIGKLEIYVNSNQVRKFLSIFALKTFCLCLIFVMLLVYLINRTITKTMIPIRRLSFSINKMDKENHQGFTQVHSDVIEVNELHSALVRMKKHYDEYQEELEDEVSDRTRQLEDYKNHLERMVEDQVKDIKLSKDAAVKANQAKTDFLANMSHELRTPMHAIISYSQMGIEKIETAEKEKLEKYFENINKSGIRLLHLLNDLLDLSKLEAGRMIMNFESSNIEYVVNDVVSEMEALIRAKSLIIHIDNDLADNNAVFDKVRISQVVMNLLSNAIKFSELGKSLIISFKDCTVENVNGVVGGVEISIQDDGIAIPDNELRDIFDKFIQSTKTKSGSGGTGLGLTICREIVRAHNGTIWAENVVNGGAKFTFRIPRQQ